MHGCIFVSLASTYSSHPKLYAAVLPVAPVYLPKPTPPATAQAPDSFQLVTVRQSLSSNGSTSQHHKVPKLFSYSVKHHVVDITHNTPEACTAREGTPYPIAKHQ